MSGPRHHPRNDPSVSCAAASPPVGVPVTVQPDSRPTNVTVPSFPLFHPPLPPQRTVKPVGGAKEDVELAGIAVGSTVGTRHHPRRVVLEHKPLVCKPPPPVDAAAAGAVAILKVPSLNPVLGGGGGPTGGGGERMGGNKARGRGNAIQFNGKRRPLPTSRTCVRNGQTRGRQVGPPHGVCAVCRREPCAATTERPSRSRAQACAHGDEPLPPPHPRHGGLAPRGAGPRAAVPTSPLRIPQQPPTLRC